MSAKRWVGLALLVFVVGSVGVMAFRSFSGGAAQVAPSPSVAKEPSVHPSPTPAPPGNGPTNAPPMRGPTPQTPVARATEADGIQPPTGVAAEANSHLVVFYFHGNRRCHSCVTIQSLTQKALEQGFASELRQGKIEWKPTNVETPETSHYVSDYRLASQSVILSQVKDGKQVGWQNLQQVWYLLGNEEEFIGYVQDGIRASLRAL